MLITIGISFYNSEKTIRDAINSVFLQTYEDWELVLIDDGSIDNSLEVVKSITNNNPKVRIISDGHNEGLSNRLNQITLMANGKYIARMDSDDIMHPERINYQVILLEGNSNIDLVGTGTYTIDENNEITGFRETKKLNLSSESVLKFGLYVHPTVTGRTEWFRNNLYDPKYLRAEDLELWCRTLHNSNYAKIEMPLFYYRENSNVNIGNYLKSCTTARLIFKTYGPAMIGKMTTRKIILKSYLKGFTYWIFGKLSIEYLLVRRRNNKLNKFQYEEALSTLISILNYNN